MGIYVIAAENNGNKGWMKELKQNNKMTKERYHHLMTNNSISLTKEEHNEGWHFCPDWDFLLIDKYSI